MKPSFFPVFFMAKKLSIVAFIFVFCSTILAAQTDFRIVFYNVENLFDTEKDSVKMDDDFTPEGFMKWTPWKYWEKLKNITRVITAVGGMQSPALVGLCEIENDSVIFDLTRRSPLRAQQYEYVVTNSPDERGIDVALLYQRHQFNLLKTNEYELRFRENFSRPTRNILHAEGKIINGDTLDVLVCHFPSRRGGKSETETFRMQAAELLRAKTDSLFATRQNAHIVIMGDFNDQPHDKSLFQVLKARSINYHLDDNELYNLFFHRTKERNFGTYKFQGNWEILDQFIVSGNLLSHNHSVKLSNKEAHVFNADFLLQDDDRYGGKQPYRTNLGPRYIGGFSDHLPIYLDLEIHPK